MGWAVYVCSLHPETCPGSLHDIPHRAIQLSIEYDPQPPYDAGSPKSAGETIVARQKQSGAGGQALREAAVRAAAARLA